MGSNFCELRSGGTKPRGTCEWWVTGVVAIVSLQATLGNAAVPRGMTTAVTGHVSLKGIDLR